MSKRLTANIISKIIALILVSIGLALLGGVFDHARLAQIDSQSPADVIQYERKLHQQGYLAHIIAALIFGPIYIGMVEGLARIIRLIIPQRQALSQS